MLALGAHSTVCCSDKANLLTETLEKQFELVKLRTSNNGTYNQGSHAKQYGTLSIDEEPVADYLGALNTGGGVGKVPRPSPSYLRRAEPPIGVGSSCWQEELLSSRAGCAHAACCTPVIAPGIWNFRVSSHVDSAP